MALSDVELNLGAGGAKIGVDTIAGTSYEVVKQAFGAAGSMTPVDADNPLPVTDAILAELPLDQASVTAGEKGILIQGATTTSAPAYSNGRTNPLSLTVLGSLRTDSSATTQPISYTEKQLYGTTTSMTVTNLNSVANSQTVGWQSVRVNNITTKAQDYLIGVKLTMANTAPANDKAVYVYYCPWYSTDGGTTWRAASQGTTTLPTGTEGATTIASPNDLRLLGTMSYTTQNMVLENTFLLSGAFGTSLSEGFSIIIIDYTGSAISASGNEVYYTPINKQGL